MKKNFKKNIVPMLLIAGLSCSAGFAQDDLLEDTESVLNSDQIDIDGNYRQKPRPSAADKLEKVRKQLEERNEQMVQKKIEDIRMREEQKLTKKLQNAFQAGMNSLDGGDSVSTRQAAPQKVVVTAPAPEKKEEPANNKVTPKFGVTTITNNENIEFESNTNFGIEIESQVSKHVSFGLNLSYMTVDFQDRTLDINNYNPYYDQNQGVDLSHQNLQIGAFSKFFLATEAKIRPYIALGVAYNRSTTEYTSDVNQYNTYNFYNYYEQIDSVQSTFISGSIFGGAEILFSETIGALIEVRYDKNINEQNENQSSTFNTNYYEQRLDQLNAQINNSDAFTLNAGLQVRF
jgi:outer membrane protein W